MIIKVVKKLKNFEFIIIIVLFIFFCIDHYDDDEKAVIFILKLYRTSLKTKKELKIYRTEDKILYK